MVIIQISVASERVRAFSLPACECPFSFKIPLSSPRPQSHFICKEGLAEGRGGLEISMLRCQLLLFPPVDPLNQMFTYFLKTTEQRGMISGLRASWSPRGCAGHRLVYKRRFAGAEFACDRLATENWTWVH